MLVPNELKTLEIFKMQNIYMVQFQLRENSSRISTVFLDIMTAMFLQYINVNNQSEFDSSYISLSWNNPTIYFQGHA